MKSKTEFQVPSAEEFEILSNFRERPFHIFGISELMKLSKKKSKPWVFNTLKKFEKKGLVIKEQKGNMNLYRALLRSPSLVGHFLFMDYLKLQAMENKDTITKLIESITMKTYCIIVFGSYAKGEQKHDSDLDVCFLVENEKTGKEIKPYINEVKRKSKLNIHENIITFKEFLDMLLGLEENLAKQIYKNHIIAFNGDIFYGILKEANKRGFNE